MKRFSAQSDSADRRKAMPGKSGEPREGPFPSLAGHVALQYSKAKTRSFRATTMTLLNVVSRNTPLRRVPEKPSWGGGSAVCSG